MPTLHVAEPLTGASAVFLWSIFLPFTSLPSVRPHPQLCTPVITSFTDLKNNTRKTVWLFLKKLNRTTIWAIPLRHICSKELKAETRTLVCWCSCSIIHNRQEKKRSRNNINVLWQIYMSGTPAFLLDHRQLTEDLVNLESCPHFQSGALFSPLTPFTLFSEVWFRC